MSKTKKKKTIDELLEEALVSEKEQPYEVPENWVWVKLGSYFEQINEQIQPSGNENYIGLEHMQKGGGILEVGTAEGVKSKKVVFTKGDVLYGKLRPYLNKHALADFDGVASTDILIYRSKNITTNTILNNYLGLPHVLKFANENSNGINLPRISPKVMNQLPFPLPPEAEQKRIAEKVERLLSKIDKAKQLIEEAKETFEFRKRELIRRAFKGELFRFSVTYKKLGEVVTLKSGKSLPEEELLQIGKIPYVKVSDMNLEENKREIVNSNKFLKECDKYSKNIFPSGTVIFPKRGGAIRTNKKRILSKPSMCDLNIMGIICPKEINPYYMYYFMQGIDLGGLDNGSSVPQINNKDIEPLLFPITTMENQEKLVKLLNKILEKENSSSMNYETTILQLETLKQSILSKAFRGELGTNNPEEESAIELLKQVLQK